MSRIGIKPIKIDATITAKLEGGEIFVEGPKGKLSLKIPRNIEVEIGPEEIKVTPKKDALKMGALWGTIRQLIANMVIGVKDGWSKTLEIQGTGFKAVLNGDKLVLSLGFSHPVEIIAPEGISFAVTERKVTVSGIDKAVVGEMAANIRKIKPPDAYKGKGIRYDKEYIKLKPGKQVKAGLAGATGGAK
jgi:large subunit ribosomal protein L6